MALTLALTALCLALATSTAAFMLTAYLLERERVEVHRLRAENVRLMDRVGYEYHLALGTPQPPAMLPETPEDEPASRPFRMRPPRPLSREERAYVAGKAITER